MAIIKTIDNDSLKVRCLRLKTSERNLFQNDFNKIAPVKIRPINSIKAPEKPITGDQLYTLSHITFSSFEDWNRETIRLFANKYKNKAKLNPIVIVFFNPIVTSFPFCIVEYYLMETAVVEIEAVAVVEVAVVVVDVEVVYNLPDNIWSLGPYN